jgi:heptosyltransferase II
MKIIISALSGIGDALMFSPALKLLREKYPTAQIDILSMFKGVEELFTRNPDINHVIHWDFLKQKPLSSLKFLFELRKSKYDVSINVYPSNRWPYNVISFVLGAKKRFGHTYNHLNFSSLNFLNNFRIKEDDLKHNVEENVRLIKLLGIDVLGKLSPLQVLSTPEDHRAAEEWLRRIGVDSSKKIIGFHAGSALLKNHDKRRWGADKFATLGNLLINNHDFDILIFGGPDEYDLNDSIKRNLDGRAHVAKVPKLMTAAALMSRCKLFISNDSGLMHIAAGLQIPVLTIFAYTNPNYVYPWGTKYTVIRRELDCSPCFFYSPKPASCKWDEDKFRCITQISVDEVYSAAKKMLEE